MYSFNSYDLSRFCDGNTSFIYFGPKNVDQNFSQTHLTLFYCKTIGPRAHMHGEKIVEFDKIYQTMQ